MGGRVVFVATTPESFSTRASTLVWRELTLLGSRGFTVADIEAVIDRLADLDPQGRAAVGCVGPDRADLIVPGCAIFAAIAALWPCKRLRVADRGLREGMLRELMGRR